MLITTSNLIAVAGVFGVGLLIGLVVLTSAEEALTAVAKTAAREISGSFWVGLSVQVLAIPLLVLLVAACAITLLAIPIVVLAWVLALAGAFTLGMLAVAIVIGRALAGRGANSTERGAALRGLTVGLATLSLIWFGAALAAPIPVAGGITRLIAVAFTWAIATVGVGAVVKSRLGMSRLFVRFGTAHGGPFGGVRWSTTASANSARDWQRTTPSGSVAPVWQTPTPIQGVVAARRPLPSTADTEPGIDGNR